MFASNFTCFASMMDFLDDISGFFTDLHTYDNIFLIVKLN